MDAKRFTLKELAAGGYVMGLSTIGEVVTHMDLHYDVYFSIEQLAAETNELNALVDGHLDDPIEMYLSDEDKRQMDADLDKAMEESPLPKDGFDDFN